ncbi:hypothetical protein D3C80_2004000 [compost metagenome]
MLDIKAAFVKSGTRSLNLLKPADTEGTDILLEMTVPDQIKALIPRNQIIRIDFTFSCGITRL